MFQESPLQTVIQRVSQWRVPPHWSRVDWREEMIAHCSAAEWQARCDFDNSRGVPLAAFLYQRMLSNALTHYRREWGYVLRFQAENESRLGARESARPFLSPVRELLRDVMSNLPASDRRLIEELFWEERTESEIAKRAGVSHQAISKRKKMVLKKLHAYLDAGP